MSTDTFVVPDDYAGPSYPLDPNGAESEYDGVLTLPTPELRHLAGKHDQKTHGSGGGPALGGPLTFGTAATGSPEAYKAGPPVEEFKAWEKGAWGAHEDLTSPQAQALNAYSQEVLLGNSPYYTSSTLNYKMRGEGFGDTTMDTNAIVQSAQIQSALTQKPIPQRVMLHRGLSDYGALPKELQQDALANPQSLVGKTLRDRAFLSTSGDPNNLFVRGRPIRMQIDTPAGTPGRAISQLSHSPTELEVLLGYDTKLRIDSVRVTPKAQTGMSWDQWDIGATVVP